MNVTSIEWTATEMSDGTMRPGFSANPLKYRRKSDGRVVWGCVKVSPGCAHCYSEALALRFDRGRLFNAANMEELEPFVDAKEVHKILTAQMVDGIPVAGSKCFLGDMTDIFGEWVNDHTLDTLFRMMCERKDLIFQILTKRPEKASEYARLATDHIGGVCAGGHFPTDFPNVWLGVSVENQEQANNRMPHLLKTQAAVRFVSYEPALGPVKLFDKGCPYPIHTPVGDRVGNGLLDWVIIGGESGHGSRPCDVAWFRDMIDQCKGSGTMVFVKQVGSKPFDSGKAFYVTVPAMKAIEGNTLKLVSSKGDDPSEWPEEIRVRQFPRPLQRRHPPTKERTA